MGWCHMGWCHMAGDARAAWWYTDLEYVRCLVLKWLQLPGPQHRTSPRSTTPHLSTHHTTISAHITPHLSAHRRTSAHISAHISVHISAHISAHMIPIHFFCLADGEQRTSSVRRSFPLWPPAYSSPRRTLRRFERHTKSSRAAPSPASCRARASWQHSRRPHCGGQLPPL